MTGLPKALRRPKEVMSREDGVGLYWKVRSDAIAVSAGWKTTKMSGLINS